jgi:hypothetical protein
MANLQALLISKKGIDKNVGFVIDTNPKLSKYK